VPKRSKKNNNNNDNNNNNNNWTKQKQQQKKQEEEVEKCIRDEIVALLAISKPLRIAEEAAVVDALVRVVVAGARLLLRGTARESLFALKREERRIVVATMQYPNREFRMFQRIGKDGVSRGKCDVINLESKTRGKNGKPNSIKPKKKKQQQQQQQHQHQHRQKRTKKNTANSLARPFLPSPKVFRTSSNVSMPTSISPSYRSITSSSRPGNAWPSVHRLTSACVHSAKSPTTRVVPAIEKSEREKNHNEKNKHTQKKNDKKVAYSHNKTLQMYHKHRLSNPSE
jgi:hypothetical protein